MKPRRLIVTFKEQYPSELVDGMLESNFMGLGKTYSGKDPRTLFLYPFPEVSERVLRETLDEMQAAGELTYIEDDR